MLPSVSRHLIYPLQESLLRRPTFSYLRQLEKSQWLTRSQIETVQLEKLRSLLTIGLNHCPWHARRIQEAGINPEQMTLQDLQRLPTMSKTDAKRHGNDIVWDKVPGGAFPYTTGGSSGTPLSFYFGRSRQASDAAGRIRARRWWGVNVGDPEVYLWGAPVELNKTDYIKTTRDRLLNQLVLNAFEMSPTSMGQYLEAIKIFKPKCIYGYASSIALLSAYAQDTGARIELPSLKVICTTGEPLYPDQRQLISETFNVPVANEFGSRDIGFTAHESPEGQMLLMSESIILETLDSEGNQVPSGEIGEAVMTGLCSDAQPFIRYRTGDMLSLSPESGKAGRGLHVIENVKGRKTDFLVHKNGSIVHALSAIYIVREIQGIEQFKIVQNTVDEFKVFVVPNAQWNVTAKRRVESGMKQRFGEDIVIDIEPMEKIALEASGKVRQVVSHVPMPLDLKESNGML